MITQPDDIKLPLYKNDGIPLFIYKQFIKEAVQRINSKISSGFYKHIENKCLCGNSSPENDILIAEKDMWGISLYSVVCSKCGLIRSKTIPDTKALVDFYETDYKTIYYHSQKPGELLFNSQKQRGEEYLKFFQKLKILKTIQTVFDYGCGIGGVLMPFKEAHKNVSGFDYEKKYIEYGNKKGLNLYYGGLNEKITRKNSQDLVIVSHVMEHFTDPIQSMQEIIEVVAPGKYLLVEVPGLYATAPHKYYPLWHLQKGHTINFFYKDFLIEFFIALGLEIIFSNERCTFICKKSVNYYKRNLKEIYSDKLKEYPQKNLDYFVESYRKFDLKKWKNPVRIAKSLMYIADFLRLRFILSLIIKDSKKWTS